MDEIRQQRPIEGQFLNFHKVHYRQSINKKLGTYVQKSMLFKILKTKTVYNSKK